MLKSFTLALLLSLLIHSCLNSPTKTGKEENITSENNQSFPTEQKNLLVKLWDGFDFTDINRVKNPEIGEQKIADFLYLFNKSDSTTISIAIDSLITRASINKDAQHYIENTLEKYLFNVNSPYYNEKYYSYVLQVLITSRFVDKLSQDKYKIQLHIINKNKIGSVATNFKFFTGQKTQHLHDISSDYIILFFYEPDCPNCQQIIQKLKENNHFNAIVLNKALMLAVYPDGDKKLWNDFASTIPSTWINAIDIDGTILKKNLYDLKASPTVYLIDKNKRVVLKDVDIKEILNYFRN